VAALPPAWLLGALALGALALVWGTRASAARTAPLYGALACALPYLPGPLPAALLAWQGLLAALVWAGVGLAVVLAQPWSSAGAAGRLKAALGEASKATAVAGLVATLAAWAAWQGAFWLVPGGDEPHYLVITQSVLLDGDLRIENNHERGDYGQYFSGVLRPDFLQRGRDGRIYSIHAPGLPVAVLPAFALGGYPAVVWLLIGCSGLGAALAWRLAWRVSGSATAAWVGWAATALTWPVLAQSFTVYPDGVAGWLFLVGSWALLEAPSGSVWRLAAGGAALAALPWMHTRMTLLAAVLGVAILTRAAARPDSRRAVAAFSFVPALSAVAWFSFFRVIYGTWSPMAPYGGSVQQSGLAHVATGLPGLLVDQQFGLLPAAPSFLLAGIGLALAYRAPDDRRTRPVLAGWLMAAVCYALAVASYPMWFGGASSPARFLVPVLPSAALPAAVAWTHTRHDAGRSVLLGLVLISLVFSACAFGAGDGQFAITQRNPFSPLLRWATRAVDLPMAVPSVLRGDLGLAAAVAAVWAGALATWWLLAQAAATSRAGAAAWSVPLAVVAGTAALTASWAAAGTPALRVQESRAALIRAAWPNGLGVAYGREARAAAGGHTWSALATVLPAVPIRISDRDSGASALLAGFSDVPPGRYRLEGGASAADAELRVLAGSRRPLATVPLTPGPEGTAPPHVDFDVPVPLSGLGVDVVPRTASVSPRLAALALRPSLAPRGERARLAARFGDVSAFVLSDRPYVEQEGIWLRAGSASMVLQAEAGSSLRVLVRNAPVANRLDVTTPAWKTTLPLVAGAEASLEIPLPQGERAVYVRFDVAEGVRPVDVDPSSKDTRRLGVWVAFVP
jgi:hypothetical protein